MDSRPRVELLYSDGPRFLALHRSVVRMHSLGFEIEKIRAGWDHLKAIVEETATRWREPVVMLVTVAGVPVVLDRSLAGTATIFDYVLD